MWRAATVVARAPLGWWETLHRAHVLAFRLPFEPLPSGAICYRVANLAFRCSLNISWHEA